MLRVFVVFHERLDPGCYADLGPLEFDSITFVAVRPDLPKDYDADRFKRVINEWDLPDYDPALQAAGYCENSVMWHAVRNRLFDDDDVVVFLQWDMVLLRGSIAQMMALFRDSRPLILTYVPFAKYDRCIPDRLRRGLWTMCPGEARAEAGPLTNVHVVRGRAMRAMVSWAFSASVRTLVESACEDDPAWTDVPVPRWKRRGIVLEHAMGLAMAKLFGEFTLLRGILHPTSHPLDMLPENKRNDFKHLWDGR